MERDLTTGSVFKTVIYFSLPYLLSYFCRHYMVWQIYLYVGQFGGVSSTTAVIDRKPDHAYADSYDRGACNGMRRL